MTNTTHYEVEVTCSTHDLLKEGVLAAPRFLSGSRYRGGPGDPREVAPVHLSAPLSTTVYVSAAEVSSDAEAVLLATQLAACTSEGMPTSAVLVDWPADRRW